MPQDSPSRDLNKFIVRLPANGLRDRIKAAAAANGRSMNAEIVMTLSDAYPVDPTLDDAIYWARTLTDDYLADPQDSGLFELQESLRTLIDHLEKKRMEPAEEPDK